MLLDHRVAMAEERHGLLEAAMNALGREAYLVADTGVVVHANALGIEALDRAPDLITTVLAGEAERYEVISTRATGEPRYRLVLGRRPRLAELADALATELGFLPRARRVLMLAADGLATKAIASRLGIANNTVDYHLTQIFARVGVAGRAELQRFLAERNG